ncbi:MAG: HAD family hydrolase [Chloroflexota bacterium]
MISAVTFDVWETMISDPAALAETRSATRVRLMTEALEKAGFATPEAEVWLAYEGALAEYERVWERNLDISTAEQLEVIFRLLDPSLLSRLDVSALRDISAAYIEPVFHVAPMRKEGLNEVLQELKRQGRRLGLVCNTGRTPGWAVRQLLDSFGVLKYFDAMAFSNEERVRKPAAEIFQRVVNSLGVSPETIAHVGDNPVADIAGAKGCGMRAILIGPSSGEVSVEPDARIASLLELIPALARLNGT